MRFCSRRADSQLQAQPHQGGRSASRETEAKNTKSLDGGQPGTEHQRTGQKLSTNHSTQLRGEIRTPPHLALARANTTLRQHLAIKLLPYKFAWRGSSCPGLALEAWGREVRSPRSCYVHLMLISIKATFLTQKNTFKSPQNRGTNPLLR